MITLGDELTDMGFKIFPELKTRKEILAAVTQNGYALKYANNQDKDIILAAVTQNGYALKYANNQDKDIILAAVTQSGDALRYVDPALLDIPDMSDAGLLGEILKLIKKYRTI